MSVFDHPAFADHEGVHFVHDRASGLNAIIAVHSTALGPAAGGCRRWQYARDEDALTDVLRLSRGMTYKNAVAGLPLGGGKSVILANDQAPKSAALFQALGEAIDGLGGRYITAEDVGIDVSDMKQVRSATAYVSGISAADGRAGGDPSPYTALGVFTGIEAAAKAALNVDSVAGLRVSVQGVGHVGYQLCRLLHEAGATLTVADVNAQNTRRAAEDFGAEVCNPTQIVASDCDILSPCALGNVLNSISIPTLKAKVVAGAANNQLGADSDGALLMERGVLYAPDYVINAGGIIAVGHEYLNSGDEASVDAEVRGIGARLQRIFDESSASKIPTNLIADELAERIVSDAKTANGGRDQN